MTLTKASPSSTSIDISSDQSDLDHRLHIHVVSEHFTHDDERIKLHFKVSQKLDEVLRLPTLSLSCSVALFVRRAASISWLKQSSPTTASTYFNITRKSTRSPVERTWKACHSRRSNDDVEFEYKLVGKDLLTNVLMLDIGYRLQTFTIELQSAAFAFLLASQDKTQKIANHVLEELAPIVQSGEGALQKISRISSDEYRQRLFDIIRTECQIVDPDDEMIDFYAIMIRIDQGSRDQSPTSSNSQMIALLLLRHWILMIEDDYTTIDSRHVRLPARHASAANTSQQLKCDLMHLVTVVRCDVLRTDGRYFVVCVSRRTISTSRNRSCSTSSMNRKRNSSDGN